MNQTTSTSNMDKNHKTSSDEFPLLEVTRTFQAPVDRVFKAWSVAHVIEQWWSTDMKSTPRAITDFRVGGKYLFGMKASDGKDMWCGGVYEEIITNKKIVCTNYATDKDGNLITPIMEGLTVDFPKNLYLTIEFEKINAEQTKMLISHEGLPKEMYDECFTGWNDTVDRLQKLVEHH